MNKKLGEIICTGNKGKGIRSDCFVSIELTKEGGLDIQLVSKVKVLFLGEEDFFSHEASANYHHLKEVDSTMIMKYDEDTAPFLSIMEYDAVVDAMLGTGAKGELRYPYSNVVKLINPAKKVFVVSVDVPSGIDADHEGEQKQEHVEADEIITFHDTKPGLKQFGKKVKIVDIGIPF